MSFYFYEHHYRIPSCDAASGPDTRRDHAGGSGGSRWWLYMLLRAWSMSLARAITGSRQLISPFPPLCLYCCLSGGWVLAREFQNINAKPGASDLWSFIRCRRTSWEHSACTLFPLLFLFKRQWGILGSGLVVVGPKRGHNYDIFMFASVVKGTKYDWKVFHLWEQIISFKRSLKYGRSMEANGSAYKLFSLWKL